MVASESTGPMSRRSGQCMVGIANNVVADKKPYFEFKNLWDAGAPTP